MKSQILWDEGSVYIEFKDALTFANLNNIQEIVHNDSRWLDIDSLIFHIAPDIRIDLDEDEIKRLEFIDIARAISKPRLNHALVCANEDISSMCALYLLYLEESTWECDFFWDLVNAKDWLSSKIFPNT